MKKIIIILCAAAIISCKQTKMENNDSMQEETLEVNEDSQEGKKVVYQVFTRLFGNTVFA